MRAWASTSSPGSCSRCSDLEQLRRDFMGRAVLSPHDMKRADTDQHRKDAREVLDLLSQREYTVVDLLDLHRAVAFGCHKCRGEQRL